MFGRQRESHSEAIPHSRMSGSALSTLGHFPGVHTGRESDWKWVPGSDPDAPVSDVGMLGHLTCRRRFLLGDGSALSRVVLAICVVVLAAVLLYHSLPIYVTWIHDE